MILTGVVALVFPMASSLAVAIMIGILFLMGGAVMFFAAFAFHGAGPFFGSLLIALLTLGCGAFLLRNPDVGLMAVTIALAVVFIIEGTFHMTMAFELRPTPGWGWALMSGLTSAALGVMIAMGLPDTSAFMLGIVVGVDFLSSGLSYVMLSRVFKHVVG
jgi:uncharacterized membrane protein HdeD (DUF308 family)